MRISAVALTVSSVLMGCAGRTPQVPYSPDPAVSETRLYAQVDRDMGKRIAATVGLPVLRDSPMSPGTREIRVSYAPGMVWDATSMLRLVERDGRVEGELYLYWWVSSDSTGRPHIPPWRRTCTTLSSIQSLVEDSAFCPVPSWYLSWRAVADSLQTLGAWDLLRRGDLVPPRRQEHVSDQDLVFVEGVIEGRYGSINYYGPTMIGDSASKVLITLGDMVVLLTRQRLFR